MTANSHGKTQQTFCSENQISAPMKHEVVLGVNIRTLKLHLNELNVMINTLQKNKSNSINGNMDN